MQSDFDNLRLALCYPDLRCFAYEHLPKYLQDVSKPFGDLARDMWEIEPAHSERGVALRKLLEAKDAAVRAVVLDVMDIEQGHAEAVSVDVQSYDNWHGDMLA